MQPISMILTVLLPHMVFIEEQNVKRMVIMTPDGSFGILPNRLDCVSALTAGIVVYGVDGSTDDKYLAVDQGVLVKTSTDIRISVRNAIAGENLNLLQAAVEEEFLRLDKQESQLRSALMSMEGSFIKQLATVKQPRALT